jgi:hypothetical protein
MRKIFVVGLMVVGILMAVFPVCFGEPRISTSVVPLPPSLTGLPTITAEPWVQIDPGPGVFLEGPAFDRKENLFVSSIFDSRILKITPKKR